jgi:hypothetical protein
MRAEIYTCDERKVGQRSEAIPDTFYGGYRHFA